MSNMETELACLELSDSEQWPWYIRMFVFLWTEWRLVQALHHLLPLNKASSLRGLMLNASDLL